MRDGYQQGNQSVEMVDVSLIAGAVSGLRVAASLAGDLVAGRDQQVLQQKVIEPQRTILDAQSSALAAQGQQQDLLDQIRSLTQQLEEATAWHTTLSRCRLEEFGDKTFSYRLRAEHRTEEPDHLICSKCVVERRRSVLNFSHGSDGKYYWDCPTCGERRGLKGAYSPIGRIALIAIFSVVLHRHKSSIQQIVSAILAMSPGKSILPRSAPSARLVR